MKNFFFLTCLLLVSAPAESLACPMKLKFTKQELDKAYIVVTGTLIKEKDHYYLNVDKLWKDHHSGIIISFSKPQTGKSLGPRILVKDGDRIILQYFKKLAMFLKCLM